MHLIRRSTILGPFAATAILLAGVTALSQSRTTAEAKRERWQRIDEIFAALALQPGATVADVGAGGGFFTTRLARAVGPTGRVYAVDIDRRALDRLRARLAEDRLDNVTVVESAPDDPRLPERTLDGALIVNAYHEMREHQAILTSLARALKTDGRLVIVEPVSPSQRNRPRADQARDHRIDPEYVMQDARAAGFRIINLQDPFTSREHDIEWLMTLQPTGVAPATHPAAGQTPVAAAPLLDDPGLRMSADAFRKLSAVGTVVVVDVRGDESFEAGHIPGAISIPLARIAAAAEGLRSLRRPIVTYCS